MLAGVRPDDKRSTPRATLDHEASPVSRRHYKEETPFLQSTQSIPPSSPPEAI